MNIEETRLEILQSVMNIQNEELLNKLQSFLKSNSIETKLTKAQKGELEKSQTEFSEGKFESFNEYIAKHL